MSAGARPTVCVLGAGRVGSLIALDLCREGALKVIAVDGSQQALDRLPSREGLSGRRVQLSEPDAVADVVGQADVVVGAVPGALGYSVLEAAIRAGKPVVDISFFSEDPAPLEMLAIENSVPVVFDCGVAPGLSNWLVGSAVCELSRVDTVEIWVGGLPFRRVWPYEYRSVFSPTDVIEEYTRPCRVRDKGREIVVEALSGIELIDFPHVGTLEAFNTDGLRSLLHTIAAPTMREKTLRYPGHAERMRMLRDSGFFDERALQVGDVRLSPRALTEKLLFRAWQPAEDEQEFTLLRVDVSGELEGARSRIRYDLFDRTDSEAGRTSMARTTGFPCAIVARMLLDGSWSRPGVHPPEMLGRDGRLTERLLNGLADRGISLTREVHRQP